MTTPPRCAVRYCTATTLHHHFLSASGAQHPEHWVRCGASGLGARCYGKLCKPPFFYGSLGDGVMSVVRPPYRYPAPLRDLQRWSDLPEGRVWITRRTSAGREAQGQTQTRNRYDRNGWEVSWRVGDTRRRYCLPSFEQAVTFARVGTDTHALVVS